MEKYEISPCPFCGGKADIVEVYGADSACVFVQCHVCGACGGEHDLGSDREACKSWNMRTYEHICYPTDKMRHLSGTDCPAWTCSNCGEDFEEYTNFCSNCGAYVLKSELKFLVDKYR